jgi:hypothetical protein
MRVHAKRRRGGIIPLVAISIVALLALVALGVDLGMWMTIRSQLQSAADVSALAGARYLSGASTDDSDANREALAAATSNTVFGKNIAEEQVKEHRSGTYLYQNGTFTPEFDSPDSSAPRGAYQVRLEVPLPKLFSRVPFTRVNPFALSPTNTSVTAEAVHRPRDIALILDFSGSMRFSSMTNNGPPPSGTGASSMNPDPVFPKFGPWSMYQTVSGGPPGDLTTYVPPSPMQRVFPYVRQDSQEVYDPNNVTIATRNGPPVVENFDTEGGEGSGTAFTDLKAPDAYATTPGGDNFPTKSGGGWAANVNDVLTSNAQFLNIDPNDASKGGYPNFKGYTQGPGYYGKTFYMWPPDPRPANDWRMKFFTMPDGSPFNGDNSRLFDYNTGRLRRYNNSRNHVFRQVGESGTTHYYQVNYTAILTWLRQTPQTLPSSLRSGRVVYYNSIPTSIPTSMSGLSQDQRFFKEYIDFVLGINNYDPAGNGNQYQDDLYGVNSNNSYGSATYGPVVSNGKRWVIRGDFDADGTGGTRARSYMYDDEAPVHPRLHFWFGALTMLDFIGEGNRRGNWWPGTCSEAQCWQLKAGIQAAVRDIRNNHPNDYATIIFFSSENGYNKARVDLGRNYVRMRNCLWYPFNSNLVRDNGSETVRPYSNNSSFPQFNSGSSYALNNAAAANIPNANGGTNPDMGLKVAYNQLSNGPNPDGGTFNGRRGATKLVVLETDGVPNQNAENARFTARLNQRSTYTDIFNVGYGNDSSEPKDEAVKTVRRIVAMEDDLGTNGPGLSTPRNEARVHAIAFGALFESNSTRRTQALQFLQRVQAAGKTSPSSTTPLDTQKIIVGDFDARIENLRSALENIFQGGVQIALIK